MKATSLWRYFTLGLLLLACYGGTLCWHRTRLNETEQLLVGRWVNVDGPRYPNPLELRDDRFFKSPSGRSGIWHAAKGQISYQYYEPFSVKDSSAVRRWFISRIRPQPPQVFDLQVLNEDLVAINNVRRERKRPIR